MITPQLREDLERIVGLDEFFGKVKQAIIKHAQKQTAKDLAYSAKERKQKLPPKTPAIQKV